MQFLRDLIFPGGYIPHGFCYLWTPGLIGLHAASDSLIALSYLSIPAAVVHQFCETVCVRALYWLLVNQAPPREAMANCLEKLV